MTFLIHALDHTDPDALNRRNQVREEHLIVARKMHANGEIMMAGALLDDSGNMKGSVLIVEMDSREKVDEWLKSEIYVTGRVWDKITVTPFRIALQQVSDS